MVMGSRGRKRGGTSETLNTLCEFCDSIKFGALGFHAKEGSDGWDYELFYEEVLGEWDRSKSRHLQEILDGEEGCCFCGKIAGRFRIFKEDPDIQNSLVFFEFRKIPCHRKGCFIRFEVKFQIPNMSIGGGVYYSVMQFQKCSQQPLKVEDFCNGVSLDWEGRGPEQAYSCRIRPLVADTRLFCNWKETCVEEHGCISSFTGERPSWLRLIDVEKRCIVDIDIKDDSSYAALSYAWVKYKLDQCQKVMPELGKSNENRFRESGSLTTETVLSTIDDAIEVLGEKYLWVDCLCTRQDDEADKGKFIPQMDLIYGFSLVTIVAASGVDADAGLPGVKRDPQTRKLQMPFLIKGVPLLQTLDPEWINGLYGEDYRYLGDFVWCKRGWTFQEKIFSGRLLIFTPQQVYWECHKATWCEDGVWETKDFGTYYRHCFGTKSNF